MTRPSTDYPSRDAVSLESEGRRMNPVPPSLTLHEGRTESEFSRRVHRNYGHHLRYVSAWGKFVVYNGQFWEVDHGHLLDAMIREQARGLFFEIGEAVEDFDSSEFRDATKFGKQMSSASGLRATRALLPSEPGMSVAVDELDQQAFVLQSDVAGSDLGFEEFAIPALGRLCDSGSVPPPL